MRPVKYPYRKELKNFSYNNYKYFLEDPEGRKKMITPAIGMLIILMQGYGDDTTPGTEADLIKFLAIKQTLEAVRN